MLRKNITIYFSLGLSILFFTFPLRAQEAKLGDIGDGSRTTPVHVINLYDEEGALIRLDDRPVLPFSTKQTCIQCHDYSKISSGWHFNASDPTVDPGRPGEPWILVDPITATQIPVSQRNWPGVYRPQQLGLTPWYFLQHFGRQMPGGGIAENDSLDGPDVAMRWWVSGKYEINCLACHSGAAEQDQAECALQLARQNYRWAAAAASGIATGHGSAKAMPDNYDIYYGVAPDDSRDVPPGIEYHAARFNKKGKVFFDLEREAPNNRCYFCHSTKDMTQSTAEKGRADKDVHLQAGMQCVDCHRNGLDHQMVRGYDGESGNSTLTCEGCHIGEENNDKPTNGRFGAPLPKHAGIPPVHFERLSCTACHSGPWPDENTHQIKTSRAHGLGTQGVKKTADVLPYLSSPVFVKGKDGKIAPHKLLWPTFWAFANGDSVAPISPERVKPFALLAIAADTLSDSTNYARINAGNWPEFTPQKISGILDTLGKKFPDEGTPTFISGGFSYQLDTTGQLIKKESPAGQPYSWAFAHDVRPASQSLGVRGCSDCHDSNSPFYFGNVTVSTPVTGESIGSKKMTAFTRLGAVYPRVFSFSFLFRPWLKILLLLSVLILSAVFILYFFKGLDFVINAMNHKE